MATQEQEAQELTDKVLNIRYALEKFNAQKLETEETVKNLLREKDALEKTNKEYTEANKTFEAKLSELNTQIQDKKNELEQAQGVFKDEIDKKFKDIEDRTLALDKKERVVKGREDMIMRDEARIIESQKNVESAVLQAEHMEKQNAIKEVELKRISLNHDTFQETLKFKEDQLMQKEWHLNLFDKSLLERESTLIGKLNTLALRESQLVQLKNAIDNDRVNLENEKNRNGYLMRALNDIQIRCITNVGQKITEQVIADIKNNVLDIEKTIPIKPSIVDKTFLDVAPVVEEETPETQEDEEVVQTSTEEEKQAEPSQDDKEIDKKKLWHPNNKEIEADPVVIPEPTEGETVDLASLSREQLELLAKDKWINVQSNRKTETIIKKLQ